MRERAQGITEYTLVIAVAATALLAMQPYFKRGVQSVVKVSLDQLGGFSSGITPDQAQKMAINQELDPKYGALKSYEIQISTDQSVTVTTPPDREGEKRTVINKWKDTVKDVDHVNTSEDNGEDVHINKGKEFYQELSY